MNVEFVLATHDPEGNLLKEPGIERIYSDSPTEMEHEDFMFNFDNLLYVWDLNRYINVFTFPFINKGILGVSSVPFTIGYDPLDGLGIGDKLIFDPELIEDPQCIALNNHYILTEHPLLKVPDVTLTLAHELGHYLGLFHVFEEDYSNDTEAYDRNEYESWLKSLSVKLPFEELASRTTSDGKKFVSYNIMDYDYSYLNQFTPNQRKRVRHVLENSPLIPGPKHTDYRTRSTRSTEIPKQRFVH